MMNTRRMVLMITVFLLFVPVNAQAQEPGCLTGMWVDNAGFPQEWKIVEDASGKIQGAAEGNFDPCEGDIGVINVSGSHSGTDVTIGTICTLSGDPAACGFSWGIMATVNEACDNLKGSAVNNCGQLLDSWSLSRDSGTLGPDIFASPLSHKFGSVRVGSFSKVTVTIANIGDADLVIGTITLTGIDISQFFIVNNNCSGQTVAPSSACLENVLFLPTSEGEKAAALSIPSNDPDTPTLDIPLTGTGVVNNESISEGATRDYNLKTLESGDPVSVGSGAYHFRLPILALGGPMNLGFELIYRTDFEQIGLGGGLPPRFWWRPLTSANVQVNLNDTLFSTFQLPDGDVVSFKKVGTKWVLADPEEDVGATTFLDNGSRTKFVMQETTNFVYLMDPVQELVYIYETFGTSSNHRIARILDRNGNQLFYTYGGNADGNHNPIHIEDGLGRSLDLIYSQEGSDGRLQTITDQGGRQVILAHPATLDTVTSLTDPLDQITTFTYQEINGTQFMKSRTLPEGNTPFTQTYAESELNASTVPRVVSQQDALGNLTTFSYDPTASKVTETRPDDTIQVYEHSSDHSLPKAITDPAGKTSNMTKNDSEQLTSITDRLGDTTSFDYQADSGKIESITNAKGDTLTYTYSAKTQTITNPGTGGQVSFTFYNLTRIDFPDGTNEQFTHDANGNVMTRVDPAGKTWTFTYNSRGQVLTKTNPTGGVITNTYNADATLASTTDSDTGIFAFAYDAFKRLTKITNPDDTIIQITYNLNDQITSITDENNHTFTATYDANGNLTKITDQAGKEIAFAYDLLDRVVQITNRLDKVSTLTYDSVGRLASTTNPNDLITYFAYDPRGWQESLTRGGQTSLVSHDDEGVVSSLTTPIGSTTANQTDELGRTIGITNPLDQTTTFERDAMSRITAITDPLSRTTNYGYDNNSLLSGVTMPVIGTVTYTRNGLGLVSQIEDLNGNAWTFDYTSMGHLSSSSDPLGDTTQHSYDSRGRLDQTAFADGEILTRTYDDAGNIIQMLFSDSTDLQFTYDALDRLITANDFAVTRDATGRVTSTDNSGTLFGATYDDGGRIETITYNNGAFTVTYTYDTVTGLLSQVTDDLTGAQIDFTYDNDFRPTDIIRSNGVNTTFTYNKIGWLTHIKDGSIIDMSYTRNAAGQVAQVDMTVPLDPGDLLLPKIDTFSFDAASQLSTTGYSHDSRGRLSTSPGNTFGWDDASRLTGINLEKQHEIKGCGSFAF